MNFYDGIKIARCFNNGDVSVALVYLETMFLEYDGLFEFAFICNAVKGQIYTKD